MALTRLKNFVDYEEGNLQYRLVKGTLEEQQKAFVQGCYSWLSASKVRQLMIDNPGENFGNNWYRTGDGADYVHTDSVRLYLSPSNRILTSGQKAFDAAVSQIRKTGGFTLDNKAVDDLVSASGKKASGIYVVDLDELVENSAFVKDADAYGHLILYTGDYAKQMDDDPNVSVLVSAGYGRGDTLDRTMADLKKRKMSETWAFTLLPEYVKAIASEGYGVVRLSAVGSYNYDSDFSALLDNIVDNLAFAFGVRSKSAIGGRIKK